MFIASAYWNGAMNVTDLRYFETEVECWEYLKTAGHWTPKRSDAMFVRVYEVFTDKKPRKCNPPKGDHLYEKVS
jgi:hypothetical protein